MDRNTTASSAEESNHLADQPDLHSTLDQIVAQINDNTDFAVVVQAILRVACQRANASEAALLVMASETTPLLRASFKVAPPHQLAAASTTQTAITLTSFIQHRVAVRIGGRLSGLLELRWAGDHQISAGEQRELEALANLAALLIRRNQADEMAIALTTKIGQFEVYKEEFIHLVAHQLRTPLTSIKGFAQLLSRQQKNSNLEAIGRYSTTILEEANRLNTMINNLLELSRMERSILSIRSVPYELNAAVNVMLSEAGNAQQIHTRLAANLPPASGDPDVLSQVLLMLITHALHTAYQHITVSTSYTNHRLSVELALAADDWPERGDDDLKAISLSQAVDSNDKLNSPMLLYVAMNLTQAMGGEITLERPTMSHSEGPPLRYILRLPVAAEGENALAG